MATLVLINSHSHNHRRRSHQHHQSRNNSNNSHNMPVTRRLRTNNNNNEASDGDLSTIDTLTAKDLKSGTTCTEVLEISFHRPSSHLLCHAPLQPQDYHHHHEDVNKDATIALSSPPRPLSPPLSTTSSFSGGQDDNYEPTSVTQKGRDPEEQESPLVSSRRKSRPVVTVANKSRSTMAIPKAIPPPTATSISPIHSTATTTVTTNTRPTTSGKQTPPPPQQQSPPIWKSLWQRCLLDCYGQHSSNNTVVSVVSSDDGNTNSDPNNNNNSQNNQQEDFFATLFPTADDNGDDLTRVVPKLCEQFVSASVKARSNAMQRLAQLCDRERSYNRIPLVCTSSQWDVVSALCRVLQDKATPLKDYRQGLLILSNLTLPMENKAVLLLGPPQRDVLLTTLYQGLKTVLTDDTEFAALANAKTVTTLKQRQLEVHLVCAILFNLSFLQDGKTVLVNYLPPPSSSSTTTTTTSNNDEASVPSALDNPDSLLRTMEGVMHRFQPFVAPPPTAPAATKDKSNKDDEMLALIRASSSVERQALRWSLGMMRNLCQQTDCARAVGQTDIPLLALQLIRYTPFPDHGQWKTQSLEDLALSLLVELALREDEQDSNKKNNKGESTTTTSRGRCCRAPSSPLIPALYKISCRDYLQSVLHVGGIHGMRAQAIVNRFDGPEDDDKKNHNSPKKKKIHPNDPYIYDKPDAALIARV